MRKFNTAILYILKVRARGLQFDSNVTSCIEFRKNPWQNFKVTNYRPITFKMVLTALI